MNRTNHASRFVLHLLIVVAIGFVQAAAAGEFKAQPTPASSVKGSKAPVRIPQSVSAELENDRQAIEAEKATAAKIKVELQTAKQALDTETVEVKEQEAAVELLRIEVDASKRRIQTSDPFEVQRFNRKVNEYNARANEAIEKRAHLNVSIEQCNELAKRHQAQVTIVNQLGEAYNAKLQRYSTLKAP